MTFPAEAEPDGNVFLPHHFVYGVFGCLFLSAIVWDNFPFAEPVWVVGPLVVALFAWYHLWPVGYRTLGAALTILGPVVALVAILSQTLWSLEYRLLITLLLLVALDDAVSHGFGVRTPLDHVWKSGRLWQYVTFNHDN